MRLLLFVALLFALVPAVAFAQEADDEDDGDFTLRINADTAVAEGEELDALVVINADVDVSGTVVESLVVINGTATVTNGGLIEGDVTVINGDLVLEDGASVHNIRLVRSDLEQASGATVTGDIDRTQRLFWWGWGAFLVVGFLLWLGATVAVLVAGALFALVARRQLATAATYMTERVGPSILAGFIVAIALPLIGVLLVASVVGIPVGIGVLLFLLPALLFLGYIVTGTLIGSLILSRTWPQLAEHTVGPALLGLLLLQLLLLVPGIGWAVIPVSGIWGTGALAYYAWNAMRGRTQPPATAAAPVA